MQDDIVVIYTANSLQEAKMLSDRLSEDSIDSFIDNVTSPLDGLTAAEQSVQVRVRQDDVDAAQRIVDEFMSEKAPDDGIDQDE